MALFNQERHYKMGAVVIYQGDVISVGNLQAVFQTKSPVGGSNVGVREKCVVASLRLWLKELNHKLNWLLLNLVYTN